MTEAAYFSDAAFFARLNRQGAANLARFERDMSERAARVVGWCGCNACQGECPITAIMRQAVK